MMVESETEGQVARHQLCRDIYNIDPTLIHHLDAADFISRGGAYRRSVRDGQAYNINADLVASELAQTLKAENWC